MQYQFEFAVAAFVAAVLTTVCGTIARRTGALALPRLDRWHVARAVPRLSGPALLAALWPWLDWPVVLALALFCGVGAWDDVRPMGPGTKAGALVVPCAIVSLLLGDVWIGVACWVSANALNMLDHADGVAASAAGASLLVAGGVSGVSGAGACAGFLIHNFPPARAFLGDSGSLMLGALLVLSWYPHGGLATLGGLAVPLLDAGSVVVKRLRSGRAPWVGGTDHTGHVLLRAGVRPSLLPALYAGAGVAFGLLGREFL